MSDIVAHGHLEIKVCVRTYRLFFVSHTEDYLWRVVDPDDLATSQEKARVQSSKRHQWLQQYVGRREEPKQRTEQVQQSTPQDESVSAPPAPEAKEPPAESQPAQPPPKPEDEPPLAKADEPSLAIAPLP